MQASVLYHAYKLLIKINILFMAIEYNNDIKVINLSLKDCFKRKSLLVQILETNWLQIHFITGHLSISMEEEWWRHKLGPQGIGVHIGSVATLCEQYWALGYCDLNSGFYGSVYTL